MDLEIIGCVAALILAYAMWRWSLRLEVPADACPEFKAMLTWHNLSESEKTTERAEAYLRKHPDDLSRRIGILLQLAHGDTRDPKKLRHHTLELIKRLPGCSDIVSSNSSEFMRNPGYCDEVVAALKSKLGQGLEDAKIHANIAYALGRSCLPVSDPEGFREWCQLPADTPLPTKLNEEQLDRAIYHYEESLRIEEDWLTAEWLAELLSQAGRLEAAVPAFEKAMQLTPADSRAGLLVDYAECLIKLGQKDEAMAKLNQVRECDTEGFEGGPGCYTMEAENLLGHLAMERKDYAVAAKHLICSTDVQGCCHNTTRGFPTWLARQLLPYKPKSVAEYCQIVLRDFTPEREEFESLLKDAEGKV